MAQGIAQLSAAMAAGDSAAVDAFYREYFDWMYGQARRITGRDESFCLDVVQDAVLRVIRTVRGVDSEVRFRSWLRLVVQTTAFDLLRNERRRKNREAMAGVADVGMEADALQLDWLAGEISRLDPEMVRIIELRFEQRWTLRRIGERLGMSVGVVDGRLRRALANLRLSAERDDDPGGWKPPVPAVVREDNSDAGVAVKGALPTVAEAPVVETSVAVAENLTSVAATPASPIVVASEAVVAVVAVAVAEPVEREIEPSIAIDRDDERSQMIGVLQEAVIARSVESNSQPAFATIAENVNENDKHVDDILVGLEDEAGAYDDRL
jgi:RNA polymerase sigma factor (sigma-70 family)